MELYEAIYSRRDIRRFRPDPVDSDVFRRILDAAHHAGSVGFMQPWNFILIREMETRRRVKAMFERENARGAENYSGERRALYDSLKLEGILEAPLNVCVTCDRARGVRCSAGTPSRTPIFSAPAWLSKTSGWPRGRRASEWGGSAFSTTGSFRKF